MSRNPSNNSIGSDELSPKQMITLFTEQQRQDAIDMATLCLHLIQQFATEPLRPLDSPEKGSNRHLHSRNISIDSDTFSEQTLGSVAISWSPQNEGRFSKEHRNFPKSPLLIHMD